MDKVDGDLFWCQGGSKLPPEVVVNGSTEGLFFLVSLGNSTIPTLYVIQQHESILVNTVNCVYSKQILEQCNNGKRTKELTFFEKMLIKYNIKGF